MDLIVQSPVLGIDVRQSPNLIDDLAAAEGTQNVDFDAGVVITPSGISRLSDVLESGEIVLGICNYAEIGGRINVVAVTETKIHRHNINNDVWDELSGDTLDANEQYPVSFANIVHQDAVSGTYQNLLICDGGRSEIIRWPGEGDSLAELAGGDGYNLGDETGHRAKQVCAVQNRAVLISPYEYNGSVWVLNESRVRWPIQAYLETWTGTGSGAVDLIDTGDTNVRAMLLGYNLIVYQKRSIWQLRYVGGTGVFTPDILVPDKGLLSYWLLCAVGGIHAFVASDYNVYLFSGGNSPGQNISEPIADLLRADFQSANLWQCMMSVDAGNRHIWIWVSRTKAYKFNLRNSSWTIRDFSNKYSSGGITAAYLVRAGSYTIGDTYKDAVADGTTYCEVLSGTAITLNETVADTTWDAGGTDMVGTGSAWKTEGDTLVSVDDILRVVSGTNANAGYYMVASVTDDTHMTLDRTIGTSPSDVTYTIAQDDGDSYADMVTEIREEERLLTGDSDGYVFYEDTTLTTDDGTEPTHYYVTKEFDGGYPDINKRIDGVAVDSRYPSHASSGSIKIEYKIDDGSWVTIDTITLTSDFSPYRRFINRTAKKIQFRYSGVYELRSFKAFNIQPETFR